MSLLKKPGRILIAFTVACVLLSFVVIPVFGFSAYLYGFVTNLGVVFAFTKGKELFSSSRSAPRRVIPRSNLRGDLDVDIEKLGPESDVVPLLKDEAHPTLDEDI